MRESFEFLTEGGRGDAGLPLEFFEDGGAGGTGGDREENLAAGGGNGINEEPAGDVELGLGEGGVVEEHGMTSEDGLDGLDQAAWEGLFSDLNELVLRVAAPDDGKFGGEDG